MVLDMVLNHGRGHGQWAGTLGGGFEGRAWSQPGTFRLGELADRQLAQAKERLRTYQTRRRARGQQSRRLWSVGAGRWTLDAGGWTLVGHCGWGWALGIGRGGPVTAKGFEGSFGRAGVQSWSAHGGLRTARRWTGLLGRSHEPCHEP